MALRDQPYLPLYVQDFLTDEKLMECSAQTVGVYIKVMCILHKQEEYGVILLKQKDKQNTKQEINFAYKIAKSLPWSFDVVLDSLTELLDEKVLVIDGDKLIQKRMVKDAEISEKRASAGKKGGDRSKKSIPKTQKFANDFAQAKTQANSEIEYVYENEYVFKDNFEEKKELFEAIQIHFGFQEQRFVNHWRTITAFVNKLYSDGLVEDFKEQFKNYHEYKKLSGEKLHSFQGLIGKPENRFEDAGWNAENWSNKILKFKSRNNNQSKFQKSMDVFASLKQKLDNGN